MASVVDAVRNSLGDRWWFVKLAVSVYILYFAITDVTKYITNADGLFAFYSLVGLYFLGTAVSAMNRNLNNIYPLYPGITSIFEIVIKAIGGFIAILGGSAITYCAFYYLSNFINDFQNQSMANGNYDENAIYFTIGRYVIYFVAALIMSAFIFIPLVLYSARGKIFDAFRLGILFRCAGDFILKTMSLIFQLILIYGIAFACIYFFLKQMFSSESTVSLNLLICIFSVIAYYTSMIYFSDLYEDAIPSIEAKK